ncbi:dephospho-CoA kinase [Microvirga pudoricolor]|uniref:dephospho-CoA kinase n=1 Tax=Microvirga pudoricolor TaxID=2778729 RepID=UPI00194FFAC9|nr:dephospho-CoA kinase [Microvirga pudoricolor]MBM6593912.1 dephospho-CoA kinase [Microvirga pudoricolor]
MTFVLGLTGSIGMGKSATAALFRERGVPVHDADASVHALYRGRAVPLMAGAFPEAVVDGAVDRAILGRLVLGQPDAMRRLEAIVHPLVRDEEAAFLERAAKSGAGLAVLDIPLLFETCGQARCDAVAVVTAAPEIQRARVLARPGMTEEKFQLILSKQMPDAQKREKAHFLVDTGRGFPSARAQVRDILTCLAGRSGRVMRDAFDVA